MTTQNAPSHTGRPDVVRCRLDHGYTEFSILAVPNVPFLSPDICSACGESVSDETAGDTKEFETTHSHSMPDFAAMLTRTETRTFTGKAYLCRTCAAAGLRLQDYIQFGFAGDIAPHLVLQVGNDKVAGIWRVVLEKYKKLLHEAVKEAWKQKTGKTIEPRFSVVQSEERYSPETSDWKAPLTNTPRAGGKGCLILLAALGGILCPCVSVLLAWLL